MKKNLIDIYNSPDTLLVLSSFSHEKDDNQSAICRYNKEKLFDLSKKHKIILCAEKSKSEPYGKTIEFSRNILISRTWEKGNIFSFFNLILFILRLDKIPIILVEFEFNVFGGTMLNLGLLLVLLILRLSGKRIIFELHQVITNISKLDKHLNITNKTFLKAYSAGICQYYRLIGIISHKVIVLEEELKKRLSNIVTEDKIQFLPHHMRLEKPLKKEVAKKALGINKSEFVVLMFGYLNWYKGVDWIINASKTWKDKKIRLLVAGGPNPYHLSKEYYQKYLAHLQNMIKMNKHITFTGFVPDKEIKTVFSASDLVVLPYRVFMAASGPFSLTLSHGIPVLLSDQLTDYTKSPDFVNAMERTSLLKSDIFFEMKQKELISMINRVKKDSHYEKRLRSFVKVLAKKRSFQSLIIRLDRILFPPKTAILSSQIKTVHNKRLSFT